MGTTTNLTSDEAWLSLDTDRKGKIFIGMPNGDQYLIPITELILLPEDLDKESTTAHIVALNLVVNKLCAHIDLLNQ